MERVSCSEGRIIALSKIVGKVERGVGTTVGSRRASRWLLAISAIIAIIAVAGIGVYGWARSATDSSQLARALIWGESSYGDQDRFPSRAVQAGPNSVVFESASDSPVSGFVSQARDIALEDLLEETETTAFIVLHGDTLLYEGYFNDSNRDALQTSFSVAKSFVATLVGIAIDEGLIDSLDDQLTSYVPELAEHDARFGDITLQHLITMSSGLSFEEGSSPWSDPANTYHGTDLRDAVITNPDIAGPPGAEFHYNDWNVIMLGLVLERATGMSVAEYTQSRLWEPMGAEFDGSWSLDSEDHGFEKMFVGVNARAIDFAKLGWIYLNEGRNGSRQVVPSDFVAEATRRDTTTNPAPDYQYLWWIDENTQSYFANGDHGQFIYVDPAAELVFVRHGRNGDFAWIPFFAELSDWLEPQLSNG